MLCTRQRVPSLFDWMVPVPKSVPDVMSTLEWLNPATATFEFIDVMRCGNGAGFFKESGICEWTIRQCIPRPLWIDWGVRKAPIVVFTGFHEPWFHVLLNYRIFRRTMFSPSVIIHIQPLYPVLQNLANSRAVHTIIPSNTFIFFKRIGKMALTNRFAIYIGEGLFSVVRIWLTDNRIGESSFATSGIQGQSSCWLWMLKTGGRHLAQKVEDRKDRNL